MSERQKEIIVLAGIVFLASMATVATLLMPGCATMSGSQAGAVAFDVGVKCAVPAVGQEALNLEETVRGAAGAGDWSNQLATLERLGVEAVICAASQVFSDLAAYHQATQSVTRGLAVDLRELHLAQYLKAHGVVVKAL